MKMVKVSLAAQSVAPPPTPHSAMNATRGQANALTGAATPSTTTRQMRTPAFPTPMSESFAKDLTPLRG